MDKTSKGDGARVERGRCQQTNQRTRREMRRRRIRASLGSLFLTKSYLFVTRFNNFGVSELDNFGVSGLDNFGVSEFFGSGSMAYSMWT